MQSDAKSPKWRTALDVVSTGALLVVCLIVAANGLAERRTRLEREKARKLPVPTVPLSLEGAARVGNETAQVVILGYSDFQCPYCAKFATQILPVLREKYMDKGEVQFAFRHLPIVAIHSEAHSAAEATECAAEKGLFWEMHDALFGSSERLDRRMLIQLGERVGLDAKFLLDCLDAARWATKVDGDSAGAKELGVSGTPAFFVGKLDPVGKLRVVETLAGAVPVARFDDAIQKVIRQQ